jgi:hypothetical protein
MLHQPTVTPIRAFIEKSSTQQQKRRSGQNRQKYADNSQGQKEASQQVVHDFHSFPELEHKSSFLC